MSDISLRDTTGFYLWEYSVSHILSIVRSGIDEMWDVGGESTNHFECWDGEHSRQLLPQARRQGRLCTEGAPPSPSVLPYRRLTRVGSLSSIWENLSSSTSPTSLRSRLSDPSIPVRRYRHSTTTLSALPCSVTSPLRLTSSSFGPSCSPPPLSLLSNDERIHSVRRSKEKSTTTSARSRRPS